MAESVFSSLKGMFGEFVSAKKFQCTMMKNKIGISIEKDLSEKLDDLVQARVGLGSPSKVTGGDAAFNRMLKRLTFVSQR